MHRTEGSSSSRRHLARLLGYTVEELMLLTRNNVAAFIHEQDKPMLLGRYTDRLTGKDVPASYPVRCVHKEGTILWLVVHASRTRHNDRPAILARVFDITVSKQTEEFLRHSETWLRLALDLNGIAIWDLDLSQNEVYVDWKALADLGLTTEFALKPVEVWQGFVHPEDLPDLTAALDTHLHGKSSPFDFEIRIRHSDGHYLWGQVRGMIIERDETGLPLRLIGTAEDISVRKAAEIQLRQYQKRLKALASELEMTEEGMRRRIATVLHDQIGQGLVSCKLLLEALIGTPSGPTEQPDRLARVSQILGKLTEQTKTLVADLGTPTLFDFGLVPALKEWLQEAIIEQHRTISVSLSDEGIPDITNHHMRSLLFRSIKEAVFNIVKHAKARQIEITLGTRGTEAEVIVADDGIGFDYEMTREEAGGSGRFGLFSVRERVQDIGGTFEVDSVRGQGTRILLRIPTTTTTPGRT